MEHLVNNQEGHPNLHKNSHKLCDETGISFWVWWKVNGNWDNNMIRISQWRESHCRTNTSIRRKKEIQKSRTIRITVRDQSRKVNHLNKVIWDKKIITKFTRSISSTRIGEPKTKTLADGLIERTSSMSDEIESKIVRKDEEGDWERKKK